VPQLTLHNTGTAALTGITLGVRFERHGSAALQPGCSVARNVRHGAGRPARPCTINVVFSPNALGAFQTAR